MNTKYEEIVNVNAIGNADNPISLNEILRKANDEQLTPSKQNKERVLFIGIDVQQDFMDSGALGVPGAHGDVERMTRFIYNNMDKISNIAVSIDTHTPHQIFHPCWWIDENGNNPAPYTAITLADLDSGKWRAVINPMASRDYVEHLEKDGNITFEELSDGEFPKYYIYNYIPPEYLKHYKDGVEFSQKIYSKEQYAKVGIASDGLRYIVNADEELKQEFINCLKSGKELKTKLFINRNHGIFKDDVTIVF